MEYPKLGYFDIAAFCSSLSATDWTDMTVTERIKALKELLDIGALTPEEFADQKTRLLNSEFSSTPKVKPPSLEPTTLMVPHAQAQAPEKSKVAAGLLALFVGSLGIHKFYLGYKSEGIIMLVITLLGSLVLIGPFVMGVISLIEGIIYLTKSDEDFNRTYVQNKKGWF